MNRTLIAGLALCATAIPWCGCASAELAMPEESEKIAAESTNRFAMDLYDLLRREEGNLFFSPYSITSALAMVWAGAQGDTAREMAETLRFDKPEKDVHAGFQTLNAVVNKPSDAVTLRVANALWGQRDYSFLQPYLDLVRTCYGGALESVDFIGDAEGARQRINAWVEKKTEDRIKDLLPPRSLDDMTRLVLTNAIYFKGLWENEFDPDKTRDEPFHLLDGQVVEAPRMHQTQEVPYAENDAVRAVHLPYQGGDVSMLVLLPRDVDGLPGVEAELDAAYIEALLERMATRRVRLGLPRFTTTSEFSMGGTLKKMGMPKAFSPVEADFSGMTGDRDLFISAVVHKAFVEVNEEGTEAAAATGVVMKITATMPTDPTEFIVDRAFLFILRHEPTGAILFMGRITDPRE